MKKWLVLLICIALLAGIASADRGVNPTPETLGIGTVSTILAEGRFLSSTDVSISITDDSNGLNGIPPLGSGDTFSSGNITEVDDGWTAQGQNSGAVYYTAVYTENTISSGQGLIEYTKVLDVDTAAKLTGQANIEAFKQLYYLGDATGQVHSDETISVYGTGTSDPEARFGFGYGVPAPEPTAMTAPSFCALSSALSPNLPSFCNSAEAWSSVDMTEVLVTTSSSTRFIMTSGATPVELNHDIRVIDSIGKASAGIDILSMEGRSGEDIVYYPTIVDAFDVPVSLWVGFGSSVPFEQFTFSESTRVDGIISTFDKSMVYESGIHR
ncbi:MAG: hypothetical protein WC382_08200 [Methanoregulaceae archaeon]